MSTLRWIAALLLLLQSCLVAAQQTDVVKRTTRAPYADVRERVVFALENRGLVVTYTAKVGDMLDRTGKDIGAGGRIYRNAEVLTFCSAIISRETMTADASNIVHCPYSIAVYNLEADPAHVHVAFRVPGKGNGPVSSTAMAKVHKLLDDIVREAIP